MKLYVRRGRGGGEDVNTGFYVKVDGDYYRDDVLGEKLVALLIGSV